MQNLNDLRFVSSSFLRRFQQFSYLLFLKQLDDGENAPERYANYNRPWYQPKDGYILSVQEKFVGVVRRVELLRGRMSEAERQVDGLFESLLAEAFA